MIFSSPVTTVLWTKICWEPEHLVDSGMNPNVFCFWLMPLWHKYVAFESILRGLILKSCSKYQSLNFTKTSMRGGVIYNLFLFYYSWIIFKVKLTSNTDYTLQWSVFDSEYNRFLPGCSSLLWVAFMFWSFRQWYIYGYQVICCHKEQTTPFSNWKILPPQKLDCHTEC